MSRLWKLAIRFSRRSSVQATELRSCRASQTSTHVFRASDIFCPKPPPTSGAITRSVRLRHADQVGNGGPRQMRHLRRAGERRPGRVGRDRRRRARLAVSIGSRALPARTQRARARPARRPRGRPPHGPASRCRASTIDVAGPCADAPRGAPRPAACAAVHQRPPRRDLNRDRFADILGRLLRARRPRRRPARRCSERRRSRAPAAPAGHSRTCAASAASASRRQDRRR